MQAADIDDGPSGSDRISMCERAPVPALLASRPRSLGPQRGPSTWSASADETAAPGRRSPTSLDHDAADTPVDSCSVEVAGQLLSSAALGMPRTRQRSKVRERSDREETRRLCRLTRPRSAAERPSVARVRRTRVIRFPYALFLLAAPSLCSTAGALAEAWNIRGNGPYPLDPYPSPFPA